MKRACLGAAIVIALAAIAYTVIRANSLSFALKDAGYSSSDFLVLGRGFNDNGKEYEVVKTSESGQVALLYLEKNNLGLWTVSNTNGDVLPGAHLVSIGWINNAGFKRFDAGEIPSFSFEWHLLYYGNNAIKRIAIDPGQLPAGVAANIQQAGSDFSIHLISYETPEIVNQIDIHSLLMSTHSIQE